jgi:DNA-binding cell septation regulator SpoVG
MKIVDNLEEFIDNVDRAKKMNPMDLSSDQDLSIALMNLISIEEHLFFSGAKTKDTSFYDMLEPIREYRKELLKKIVKTYDGEVWCISKHLLASCMRLMEVGTKALAKDPAEAHKMFERAYDLYCLFWGLNINSIDNEETKSIIKKLDKQTLINIKKDDSDGKDEDDKKQDLAEEYFAKKEQQEVKIKKSKGGAMLSKLKNFVSTAIDCCRE